MEKHFVLIFFKTILLSVLATSSTYSAENNVPAGFESLAEEQTTEIDLYYGGRYLTSALARFDHQLIRFNDPESIAALMNNINAEVDIADLLGNAFATNEHLVCYSNNQIHCGSLETNTVELIFNRSTLEAWLFVSADFQSLRTPELEMFIPHSTSGTSLINNTNFFYSKFGASDANYSLVNSSILAMGENRLQARSLLNSGNVFEFDELSLKREFLGRSLSLGLIRPELNIFNFEDPSRYVGLSYASSLNTRADLQSSLGTQVQLYLATRSRVEIYRNNVILDTAYYDSGNQVLDTSRLPNGSYYIDLRIVDSGGNVRTERQLYSKTSRIPPKDQNLFFIETGELYESQNESQLSELNYGSFSEGQFLRAGFSTRLTDTSSASIQATIKMATHFWKALILLKAEHRNTRSTHRTTAMALPASLLTIACFSTRSRQA